MTTRTMIEFDNTYARELGEGFSVPWQPAPVTAPHLLYLNEALAAELGLNVEELAGEAGARFFSGAELPEGAQPIAQAYAGHQFGGFSPQLGDGRALLVGELIDRNGQRRDIAFKGSGRTPFSRGGDGKAAVGPMLREALVSEGMYALGIPTTRALAVVATGEPVYRERTLPGAILTRVAASHLRVGTFQFFAARGDGERVKRLADYAIARHDPHLVDSASPYLGLLKAVARRQAALIAQWMNVGFLHGVMNTDNMTLSGETIDYGPCAFLEAYDPAAVFSSIDEGGRYAFANQPRIARWNLARFAETLLPLIDGDPERAVAQATEVIDAFPGWYEAALRAGQAEKLGLEREVGANPQAVARLAELVVDWLAMLADQRVDHTLGWRRLCDAAAGDPAPLRALFPSSEPLAAWLERWQACCTEQDQVRDTPSADPSAARVRRMRAANPYVIPRNHRVEEALQAASETADFGPFERLLAAITRPFDENAAQAPYAEPAPSGFTERYQTFCGT